MCKLNNTNTLTVVKVPVFCSCNKDESGETTLIDVTLFPSQDANIRGDVFIQGIFVCVFNVKISLPTEIRRGG